MDWRQRRDGRVVGRKTIGGMTTHDVQVSQVAVAAAQTDSVLCNGRKLGNQLPLNLDRKRILFPARVALAQINEKRAQAVVRISQIRLVFGDGRILFGEIASEIECLLVLRSGTITLV